MDSTQPRWRTQTYEIAGPDYLGSVFQRNDDWIAWIRLHGDVGTWLGTFPSSYDAKQAVEKAVWNRTYQAVTHA